LRERGRERGKRNAGERERETEMREEILQQKRRKNITEQKMKALSLSLLLSHLRFFEKQKGMEDR
jgi:hypothetical protein